MAYARNLTRLQLPVAYARLPGTYWNPNPQFIDELVQFLDGKRVLEIFSGNGYLAALLAARGIAIRSTTQFSGHDNHEQGVYYDVEELDAVSAVNTYGHAHDVLLVCWPTVTPAVLHAVSCWGSDRDIVFIGEVTDYSKNHLGGCATDAFYEHMSFTKRFETYRGNYIEQALVGRYISP
jgi:hypothetical protein